MDLTCCFYLFMAV